MGKKGKNLTQNYDLKLKVFSSLSFKFCSCVFQFSLLAFCFLSSDSRAGISSKQLEPTKLSISHLAKLSQDVNTPDVSAQVTKLQSVWREPSKTGPSLLWQVGDVGPVGFASQVDQNSPQSNLNIVENLNTRLEHQLWWARISSPKSEEDKKSKNELQQLIKQIYSIEFKPRNKTRGPIIAVKSVPSTEPDGTLVDTNVPEEREEKEIKPKLPYEPVSDQTLQMLRNLLQHPGQLDNPFEMGEVLFLSGHLKEAAIVYKEALNRKNPDEADLAQDRAWILFQIGNCLRNDDLPAASKMHKQLIAEYPDSPWSDLAKAQRKLIDWYLKDKPRTLITRSEFSDSLVENGVSRK